jgi:hypothetical protein
MSDDPTEEIIKREVAEAARILREDGHAANLSAIRAKLDKHFPDENPDGGDIKDGPKPPDKKDPADAPPKRKGLWWGEDISDE